MDRGLERHLEGGSSWIHPLGEVLKEHFKRSGLAERMKRPEVHEVWTRAAGARAAQTRIVGVRSGVLEVEVASAPLLHELEFSKRQFLKALQAEIAKPFIERIVLRLGSFERERD